MHRFYVAPREAAQPGNLLSYQQVSNSTIQGAKDHNAESYKKNIYNRKIQGLNDGIKSVSDNHTVEFKH
jgi:hypothetical protein